jgi:hypothetical protein
MVNVCERWAQDRTDGLPLQESVSGYGITWTVEKQRKK